MAFKFLTPLLQLLFLSSLFASCICVENSEPGTVGDDAVVEANDDGTVEVAPVDPVDPVAPPPNDSRTTLPPFLYTTLTYRQTPAQLPDTTRYVHTPGVNQNTVVTHIPIRTNRPSTIFPPDDPFGGASSFLRRDIYTSMATLTAFVLVSLFVQRLLRHI